MNFQDKDKRMASIRGKLKKGVDLKKMDSKLDIKQEAKQVDANNKIIICNVLQDFVKTKQYTFNDFGNVMYEFLLRLGIINFSKDEKNEFLKQSRVQLRIELSDRNEQLTKLGKTFHKIDLKKAFQEIEYESNKDYETQIIMLAKKNALKKFIETCADTEIDLENLINEKLEEDGNK